MDSQASQIFLLSLIVQPKVSSNPRNISNPRARAAPTKIKALYHLYQLTKNKGKKKSWTETYQGKTLIASKAKISRRHFTEFINDPDFSLFCKLERREGTTHKYHLHDWVIEAFRFFEKTGMMRDFRSNFGKWKEKFLKRTFKWLLPLLEKGLTFEQILNNHQTAKSREQFIDKNGLKGSAGVGLKGSAINSSTTVGSSPISSMKLDGSRSNIDLPDPIIQEFIGINRELRERFHLADGDIRSLNNYFGFHRIKGGIRMMENWLTNGMRPASPIKAFMGAMKAFEKNKKKYQPPPEGILAPNGKFVWNPRNQQNCQSR